MNREQKIELFLQKIQSLSKQNIINADQVYLQLINYGIPEKERRIDISKEIENQVAKNKENPKTRVFVSKDWSYFCQYISKKSQGEIINETNSPIKVYVPLKKENIESSLDKIISFIEKNDILHMSKLAKETRIDNLVLRFQKIEDANKVINYINSNDDIKTYEPSFFAINNGKVAIAMDRTTTYNGTISMFIYMYIKEANKNNTKATFNDFKTYLKGQLSIMRNQGDLSQIISYIGEVDPKWELISIEGVLDLFLKSFDPNIDEALIDFYHRENNICYVKEKIKYYEDFSSNNSFDNDFLLEKIIQTMSKKYGKERTYNALIDYKKTGDINYITRENNLRKEVMDNNAFRTYINTVNLKALMDQLVPTINVNRFSNNDEYLSKEKILELVSMETYKACQTEERNYSGTIQVASMLIRLGYGDYQYITRTNNARSIAKEKLKPEEIEKLMKNSLEQNGYILENEKDLYELYAHHIEYLCEKEKGNHHAR